MSKLIESFPFTVLLSIVGFFVGSIMNSGQSIFENYNFSGLASNPISFLGGYFFNFLIIVVDGALIGLLIGAVLGFVGLIIDFSRRDQ